MNRDLNELTGATVKWGKSGYPSKPPSRIFKERDKYTGQWVWKEWCPCVFIPILVIAFFAVFTVGGMAIMTKAERAKAEKPSSAYVSGDIFYTTKGNAIDLGAIRSIESDDSMGFIALYFVSLDTAHRLEISTKDGERLIEAWQEYKRRKE